MKFNSYTEWDPLLEVLVGSVIGAQKMAFEPSFGAYFPPSEDARRFPGGHWDESEIQEAQGQLDNLSSILEARGIRVQRPDPYPADAQVKTPDFHSPFGNCFACPRDVLLIVGDLAVEAPMAQRGRFFEYRGYRRILLEHFEAGGRWIAAPKPLMDDASFASNYTTINEAYHPDTHPLLLTKEPCFDAASFTRCGRDIFWQPDMVSNAAGAEWLRRLLGTEFRVHRVEFEDRYPQHIDTTLVPLRPGLVMVNPERPARRGALELFEKNGWQIVTPPPSVRAGLAAPARDVSNWISINTLVIDPKTIIIEQDEDPLADFLESLSFEVVRVPFDKVYKFGGGFHCCTVDLRRDGGLVRCFDD